MLGLGSPVIALPRGLVAALPDADVDRVVLHEYGHVQRRDDWATFAQASVEALLGWQQAVWWIGRNLCLEREVACDDWVIRRTAAPRDYASCLARVAGITLRQPALPFASRALRSRRELFGRVERLLNPMRNAAVRPIRSVLAISTLALATVVVFLGQTPPIVTVGTSGLRPTVPAIVFAMPHPTPKTASVRAGWRIMGTSLADGQTGTGRSREFSASPRSVNQATPLKHDELSTVSGLTSPDSLRPAGSRRKHLTADADQGSWRRIAYAGKAVSVGASRAGVATASAFHAIWPLSPAGLSAADDIRPSVRTGERHIRTNVQNPWLWSHRPWD